MPGAAKALCRNRDAGDFPAGAQSVDNDTTQERCLSFSVRWFLWVRCVQSVHGKAPTSPSTVSKKPAAAIGSKQPAAEPPPVSPPPAPGLFGSIFGTHP